jgi:hypothetical protein
MMEPGPALFFTQAELKISPEPPLPAGSDKIDVAGLDPIDQELHTIGDALEAVRTELFNEAMGWQDVISQASSTLDVDLAETPLSVSQSILDSRQPAQDAIDGAESSFLPDAYQEHPPWYQPPSNEIPDEDPRQPPRGPSTE